LISCSPALLSLCRGNSLPREGGGPGRVGNPHLLSPRRGGRGAMTKGSEQAGRGGAAPGTGGRPKDTGTCSSARIDARNCSIRTLPVAPPALSTPAGGTRRPLPPPGTSLRTTTPQLSFLFCSNQSRSESQCRPAHRPAGFDFRSSKCCPGRCGERLSMTAFAGSMTRSSPLSARPAGSPHCPW
jgi:hypothetical protein